MLKVFDCFAGYGGAEFALKKAGIPHECIGFSEIDKYAIMCFQQNHEGKNFGDITKINWDQVPNFDLLTGGFPCQDISQAGKQDLSKGRSILINELIRALKEKQPKYFLFENVGAIETKPFKEFLRGIENDLKSSGYIVFRKMLNSKHFGIPQNRERVWWIGYRKDIYNKPFGWTPYPHEIPLILKLKDVIEKEVDRKYYLTEKQINSIVKNSEKRNKPLNLRISPNVSTCLTQRVRDADATFITNSSPREFKLEDTISPTLLSRDYKQPKTVIKGCALRGRGLVNNLNFEVNKEEVSNALTSVRKDSLIVSFSLQPGSGDPKKGGTGQLSKSDGTSYCLDTGNSQAISFIDTYNNTINSKFSPTLTSPNHNSLRLQYGENIRKLTPTECFRLMGFLNDEVNLEGLSDTQKYKLAGNGWDINLVSKLFKQMELI